MGSVEALSNYRYQRALEDLSAAKQDAEEQVEKAEKFIAEVEMYLKDKKVI